MERFRVLVTGARKTTPAQDDYVAETLAHVCRLVLASGQLVTIIEGRCLLGGVDLAAQRWAERTRGVLNEGHPADWAERGRAAGPIRNSRMVAAGADLCVAFPGPGSRGTWDCVQQAAKAGIPGRWYPLG